MLTRKNHNVWLIGFPTKHLSNTLLPSKKEVLSLFFYYKNDKGSSIKKALGSSIDDVFKIWNKARIPTCKRCNAVVKLERLFNEWNNLKKNKENKKKRSTTLDEKETNWKNGLDILFDIAHANASKMIKIKEDNDFLMAQRDKRRGKMMNIDSKLTSSEIRKQNKIDLINFRKEKEKNRQQGESVSVVLTSDSESESDTILPNKNEKSNISAKPIDKLTIVTRARKPILNRNITAVLDRTKVSDRSAAMILAPVIRNIGVNPSDYCLNRSSIRRDRIKHRQMIAEDLKKEFKPQVSVIG